MALTALALLPLAIAQSPDGVLDFNKHVWASYSGDHPVAGGPWGIHFDAQWRRSDLGTEWQQYQLRPGVNYSLSPNVLLTLGYVYTRSYPYGDFPVQQAFPEHRTYQQAVIKHSTPAVRLQHRIRFEERFVKSSSPQSDSWTYRNRFRYLLKTEIPIGGTTADKDRWYIPIFDEVLFGIPPNIGARTFDQNRVFIGVGKAVGGANIEVGYMNQFLGQGNGRIWESNNTLVISVSSSVPLW